MSADAALVHIGLYQRRCGLCNDALPPWMPLCDHPQCQQRLGYLTAADRGELIDYALARWEAQTTALICDDTCPWCLSMVPAGEDRIVYRCPRPQCLSVWCGVPLFVVARFFEAWERSKRGTP